ncbi:MAG: DUF4932 domain-containing protein [Mariniphaga sp.]
MKNKGICGAMIILLLLHAVDASASSPYQAPEPVSRVKNGITVCVHPQVELISVIQTIGNYPAVLGFLMAKDSSRYKTEVTEYFAPYKEHPAVKMFDRLSSRPRMLNFSAPSNLMLYTDNNLNLRKDIKPDDFVLNRAGGKDSLAVFLDLLRDFAIRSSFNTFYNEHSGYYRAIIDATTEKLGDYDYISELEAFYGRRQKSYAIVLVSLYNFVGFGNSLLFADDMRGLYNTMGAMKVEKGIPDFGDTAYLKYMIRHEFSHPFINPLTEKYWDYIKADSLRYESIPEVARKKVCGDWQECINEFVIRAVTTHIAYNESEETGKWAYEKEKVSGVSCLEDLLEKVAFFQANRKTYPTFESYYYKMLDVFKEEIIE